MITSMIKLSQWYLSIFTTGKNNFLRTGFVLWLLCTLLETFFQQIHSISMFNQWIRIYTNVIKLLSIFKSKYGTCFKHARLFSYSSETDIKQTMVLTSWFSSSKWSKLLSFSKWLITKQCKIYLCIYVKGYILYIFLCLSSVSYFGSNYQQ